MNEPSPQGPTIPSSTKFTSNRTRILKVTDTLETHELKSQNPLVPGSFVTMKDGYLSGLNDPVLDHQGATYGYLLQHGSSGNPGDPLNSIQYNNGGMFTGSPTLLFNKDTSVLTANSIGVDSLKIASNTITGLVEPVSNDQAATKDYVNKLARTTITEIPTSGSVTYDASELIGGFIYRNNQSSSKITDSLPSAAQIIAETGGSVGNVYTIRIRNVSSNYDSIVSFDVGSGITPSANYNIYAGYQYTGLLRITDASIGSEALTLYTLDCIIVSDNNWSIELGGMASSIKNIVADVMVWGCEPFDVPELQNYIIDDVAVISKIIRVTVTSPTNVLLDKPDKFIGVYSQTSDISLPLLWSSGGCDFFVLNASTTPGANITIVPTPIDPGDVDWTMDPNCNFIIPPGYTGRFMMYITVTNYPVLSSLINAKIYSLGITVT